MKITKLFIAVSALFLFNSCKKSATSDQAIQFQLSTVSRTAIVNAPLAPGSITWSTGTANATLIKLEAKNSSNTEVEFKSQMAQQINLFSSVAANLGNVVLPPGVYSEVEFKIDMNQNGSSPALELNGQFTSGTGITTAVKFQVNSLLEIKGEQANVTITDNSSTTAVTSLNLSALTIGISQVLLNSATVTNNTILISSSSNTNLYNIILANLIQSHEVELHH